jgi:hypothetical protein
MVFAEIPNWMQGSAGSSLAERGESMGLIPFPRPDDIPAGDPRYRQESSTGNSIGILKGVDSDTARLALEAYKIYCTTMIRELGGVSSVLDYLGSTSETNAVSNGYDIFHPQVGKDTLEIFASYTPMAMNEFVSMLGVDNLVLEDIVGQSIYSLDGSPKYEANVAQKKHLVEERLASTVAAIASGQARDNIAPGISFASDITLPKGTNLSAADLSDFITITDNVDGNIPLSNAVILWGETDKDTVGEYNGQFNLAVTDASGNSSSAGRKVYIYDPDNTVPPVIALKADLPAVAMETNASDINWRDNYVDTARDADGYDIKGRVFADLSELDTTTPGTYDVELTVTDFAGNKASVVINVVVEVR